MYKEITKEDIEREYIKKVGVSGRTAAKNLGITYKTFKHKLKENNIVAKKRNSKYPELNNKEWIKEEYFKNKKSIRQIAKEINATIGAVGSAIRFAGIDLRSPDDGFKQRFPNGRFGKDSSNWKGGVRMGGKDLRYTMIQAPNHPHADSSGYVMEHRLVMEKQIGRYLTKDEIIHHLDGNGHNNNIENLQLTTRKKHFKDHFDAVKEVDRLKTLLTQNGIPF